MFPPSFYLNSNPGLLIPLSRIPPAFFHFHSPSLPPLPRLTAVFSSLPLFSFPFRIKIPCSVNNRVQRDHRYRSRIITQTQLHVLFFFRRFYFFFFIHFPSLLSFGKINFRIDKRFIRARTRIWAPLFQNRHRFYPRRNRETNRVRK